ncbi:hypothetical protein RR46_06696 [Papilio xuthus]|uniref:Uncharacterized protein n=1 Tax=Papilio xuthus TaxID=66420 RepID=A0A194PSY8_PAPXU|nr:hypothetical protein RR46_06696 [Papilio xuthus]
MESINSTSPDVCVNVCEESIKEDKKKKSSSISCWCSAFIKLIQKMKSKGNETADDSLETIQLRVMK